MSEKSNDKQKGILKNDGGSRKGKSFQWDEMNILATYHPADKLYGHMKIDEPKTPYNFDDEPNCASSSTKKAVSPEELAAVLAQVVDTTPKMELDPKHDADAPMDATTMEHKRTFEAKRRAHYNEFLAAKLSKENITDSDSDIDADDAVDEQTAKNAELNRKP